MAMTAPTTDVPPLTSPSEDVEDVEDVDVEETEETEEAEEAEEVDILSPRKTIQYSCELNAD
jgi:hypothetical protein